MNKHVRSKSPRPTLFCKAMSEAVATSLLRSPGPLDHSFFFWLVGQRDELGKSSIKTAALLFTTFAILALVFFGKAENEDLDLLGIKIKDKTLFVFLALVLGNLLYVVSTGIFLKGIAYEFLIKKLTAEDCFKLGTTAGGFLASHPGNILSYAAYSGLVETTGRGGKALIWATDVYMKYIMIVCYGVVFYTVLILFLIELWMQQPTPQAPIYFWVLVALNVMTAITSFVIFLPIREHAK